MFVSLHVVRTSTQPCQKDKGLTIGTVLAAVGVKLTGVDNSTYSLTGESYSAIIGPNTESNTARVLQKDDVALGTRS